MLGIRALGRDGGTVRRFHEGGLIDDDEQSRLLVIVKQGNPVDKDVSADNTACGNVGGLAGFDAEIAFVRNVVGRDLGASGRRLGRDLGSGRHGARRGRSGRRRGAIVLASAGNAVDVDRGQLRAIEDIDRNGRATIHTAIVEELLVGVLRGDVGDIGSERGLDVLAFDHAVQDHSRFCVVVEQVVALEVHVTLDGASGRNVHGVARVEHVVLRTGLEGGGRAGQGVGVVIAIAVMLAELVNTEERHANHENRDQSVELGVAVPTLGFGVSRHVLFTSSETIRSEKNQISLLRDSKFFCMGRVFWTLHCDWW